MDLHFEDLALTIKASDLDVHIPYNMMDEVLFLSVRSGLIKLLSSPETEILYFGPAPDNTADGQDELLENGIFYRIIGYEKNLGVDLHSSRQEILSAFHDLVCNFQPRFTTIFLEQGVTKKEVTIELMYQQVY